MEAAVGRFHRRALTQQQDPAVNLDLGVSRARVTQVLSRLKNDNGVRETA